MLGAVWNRVRGAAKQAGQGEWAGAMSVGQGGQGECDVAGNTQIGEAVGE